MKFIDEVKILVISGSGGNGCTSFRREKFVPRGGPDGGDGGNGGSVIIVADSQKNTLVDLFYKPQYRARRGQHGKGKNQHGKGAPDTEIHVPPGCIIFDAETGEQLVDLDHLGASWVAAKGGRGGRGNKRFLTNANKAPTRSDPGEEGTQRWLRVELKTLAEVGLLGFPSAGKSTLIAAISAARPKIADYPFTTLTPNLGTVNPEDEHSFVVADIPGIIEGASEGVGLGLRFLRHIERTRLLVHMLDLDPLNGRDPYDDFVKLNAELASYSEALAQRTQIVVANKIDMDETQTVLDELTEKLKQDGYKIFPISAEKKIGIDALLKEIDVRLKTLKDEPME